MMMGRSWVRAPVPLMVSGMFGLGDNLMQRPFIRAASANRDVYLRTPWPELYLDMPRVYPVKSQTDLRTQANNERLWRSGWYRPPPGSRQARLRYGPADLRMGSIYEAFDKQMPLNGSPLKMDLPALPSVMIETQGLPLAVVKPATARKEWLNTARNPRPDYLAEVCNVISRTHFVVAIGHLHEGAEWLDGEMPVVDLALMRGELSAMQALSLVASADVVVGGVGWIVPAAIAAKRPAFIVGGGQGAFNAPEVITDPRLELSKIKFALPDLYCRCEEKSHNCNRDITGLRSSFEAWANSQGVEI